MMTYKSITVGNRVVIPKPCANVLANVLSSFQRCSLQNGTLEIMNAGQTDLHRKPPSFHL